MGVSTADLIVIVAESPINNLRITYESPKIYGCKGGFFDKLVERNIEFPTRKAREIL